MEDMNRSLAEFLRPEIQASWGVSKSSFSNPSWNILIRALYRADLISDSGMGEEILISQLSCISVADIRDIKHVGEDRLKVILHELSLIDIPAYEPVPEISESEKLVPLSIEQWLIIKILSEAEWRDEFLNTYGYPFDMDIFDDEIVGRKIRVLELRMNGATLDEIGKQFGLSRERIRQILKEIYKLVEGNSALEGRAFSEIFANKTHGARGEEKRVRQKKKEEIDSRARVFLNSRPGATYLELSQVLGVSEEDLQTSLQPQTAKFVWTKVGEKINESPFSDEAILEALKQAEAFESPISAPMYRDLVERGLVHGPGPQTVAQRFGTWKRACELADVTYNESVRTSYDKQWTELEMIKYVVDFLLSKGFGKAFQNYDEWRIETMTNAPSGAHVRKKIGTWTDVRNRALMYMRENDISCDL
jgi:hypothetical protein